MFRNCSTLALAWLLSAAVGARPALAAPLPRGDVPTTQKVKEKVLKFGVGEKARVYVKLKDGRKLKGYVSEAGEGSFVVRDEKTDATTTIAYSDVEQIKGKNLSTGAKVAIGVGIGAAVFLVVAVIAVGSALAALNK